MFDRCNTLVCSKTRNFGDIERIIKCRHIRLSPSFNAKTTHKTRKSLECLARIFLYYSN